MPQTLDTQLETTFNDLAMARLRDKCPALLDYLVGFEMIKSEEDGAKCMGIFGFEIDDSFYYVPLVYLNGEVKGLDAIYSVDADLMLPLSEKCIDTIIQRKSSRLGEADTRSRSERGVKLPNYATLRQLPGMSGVKFAAAIQQVDLPAYDVPSLPDALRQMGKTACAGFRLDVMRHPKLAAALENFYDLGDFYDPEIKTAAENQDPVIIVGDYLDAGAKELTDAQRETVLSGGLAVVDKRPEVKKSIVYRTVTPQALFNPTDGGLYELVMADGTVRPFLVLRVTTCPETVTVYDPENGRYGCMRQDSLWARVKHDNAKFRQELEKVGVDIDKLKVNDVAVFVSLDGEATASWSIRSKITSQDGVQTMGLSSYWMWGDDQGPRYRQGQAWSGQDWRNQQAPWNYRDICCRIKSAVVVATGNHVPKYTTDKLLLNRKCFRALVIDSREESRHPLAIDDRDKEQLGPWDFGDTSVLLRPLEKTATAVDLWRAADGLVNVRVGANKAQAFEKKAAMLFLANDLGIDGELAVEMVQGVGHGRQTHKVKLAAELLGFPDLPDFQGGGFMNAFIPEQTAVDGMAVAPTGKNEDVYRYVSPFEAGGETESGSSTLDTVDTAAKSGQKEVFDASVLLSLLKTHNPEELIERYVPTITAGMDRLGRLLYVNYWHYDKLKEQYGAEDIDTFIDDLRNVFTQLGDVVMFLKQPSLAGDPTSFGLGLTGGGH